jgi:hypothetical protein
MIVLISRLESCDLPKPELSTIANRTMHSLTRGAMRITSEKRVYEDSTRLQSFAESR